MFAPPAAVLVTTLLVAAGCSGGLRVGAYAEAAAPDMDAAADAAADVVADVAADVVADVAGDGALAAARLVLTPTTADFGAVALGQSSDEVHFLVSNEGSAGSDVLEVSLAPKPFAALSDDCSKNTLAPGAFCTVGVSYSPDARGALSGTLTVTGDPGGALTAKLTGSGNNLTASPAAVDDGCVTAPSPTSSTTITFRNDGAKATGLLIAEVSGEGFAIVSRSCDKPLNPGASCTVSVSVVLDSATVCTAGCLHVYRASLTVGDGTSKISVSLSAAVAACT